MNKTLKPLHTQFTAIYPLYDCISICGYTILRTVDNRIKREARNDGIMNVPSIKSIYI
jgi:hypothetical protein